MPGRPKKPIGLHKVQGTARKQRLEDRINELNLPAGPMGDPPEWFGDLAREEWSRLTNHEQYRLVLNPVHRSILIQHCALEQKFMLSMQGGAPMTASEFQMYNSGRMQLGITPASQSKVKMPTIDKPVSKWADTKPIPISKLG